MTGDRRYINGPCQTLGLHHRWHWYGKCWKCATCGCTAFDLKRADTPCLMCGSRVEDRVGFTCDPCFDAMLGLDADENYVPFDEKYYQEEVLP